MARAARRALAAIVDGPSAARCLAVTPTELPARRVAERRAVRRGLRGAALDVLGPDAALVDLRVVRDGRGAPSVLATAGAAGAGLTRPVAELACSAAHEGGLALAVVVGPQPSPRTAAAVLSALTPAGTPA